MQIVVTAFDNPDAVKLIAEVQQEYVVRYGGEDGTPVDPAEFAPPRGLFLVAYVDGTPAAMWPRSASSPSLTSHIAVAPASAAPGPAT